MMSEFELGGWSWNFGGLPVVLSEGLVELIGGCGFGRMEMVGEGDEDL